MIDEVALRGKLEETLRAMEVAYSYEKSSDIATETINSILEDLTPVVTITKTEYTELQEAQARLVSLEK